MSSKLPDHWPVIGICGFSGSGKTTLIENLVRSFSQIGWSIGVVKLVHGMDIDHEGKDTDRFYRSGATVFAYDSTQWMLRQPADAHVQSLDHGIRQLIAHNDLVLIEGHKSTPLPVKIWIQSDINEDPPQESGPVLASLGRNAPRLPEAFGLIRKFVEDRFKLRPVTVGILSGECAGSFREEISDVIGDLLDDVVLIGDGHQSSGLESLKRVSPATDVPRRIASIVAALRWAPDRRWVFLPVPAIPLDAEMINRLIDSIRPGVWASFVRSDNTHAQEPYSCIDARFLDVLLETNSFDELATHSRVSLIDRSGANT